MKIVFVSAERFDLQTLRRLSALVDARVIVMERAPEPASPPIGLLEEQALYKLPNNLPPPKRVNGRNPWCVAGADKRERHRRGR